MFYSTTFIRLLCHFVCYVWLRFVNLFLLKRDDDNDDDVRRSDSWRTVVPNKEGNSNCRNVNKNNKIKCSTLMNFRTHDNCIRTVFAIFSCSYDVRYKANDGVGGLVYDISAWLKYGTALSGVVQARTAYSFIQPSSEINNKTTVDFVY